MSSKVCSVVSEVGSVLSKVDSKNVDHSLVFQNISVDHTQLLVSSSMGSWV